MDRQFHYTNMRAVVVADADGGLCDRVYLIPDSMDVDGAMTLLEASVRHVKAVLAESEHGYGYDDLDKMVSHSGLRPINTLGRTTEFF